MALMETLRDYQSILDNERVMNFNLPGLGEETTDDWYLTTARWNTLDIDLRNNYCFNNVRTPAGHWGVPYKIIYYANLALEGIQHYRPAPSGHYDVAIIEGTALFHRAHAYYHLAQVFAPAFEPGTPNDRPGIVLRHEASIDEQLHRATVGKCYAAMVADLQTAAQRLPLTTPAPTRPSRAAAWALLARVYLLMADFEQALLVADSALTVHANLMDYADLNSASNNPFTEYNEEVLFQSQMLVTGMAPSRANIHPDLYDAYADGDLRKVLFFRPNTDGTYRFKGGYDGVNSGYLFNGISTAELYLIKAECLARLGLADEALSVLNTLLETRWQADSFVPKTRENTPNVLYTVLEERRKELPYRGLRWPDLRRLSIEGLYTSPIVREVDGKRYELSATSIPTYTYALPEEVIDHGGYPQN